MLPTLDAADTSYSDHLTLRETRYSKVTGADLVDDGIIDEVAIERRLGGDPVRISPREVVCIIAEGARRGLTDAQIAERLSRPGRTGERFVERIRAEKRIDLVVDKTEAKSIAEAIMRPNYRHRLSAELLRAGGLSEAAIAASRTPRRAA